MSPTRPRWLASAISDHFAEHSTARHARSCPPPAPWPQLAWSSRIGRWLGTSGWSVAGAGDAMPALGERRRVAALASARLDFAEALFDVRTPAAASLLDRIAVIRSLHELWHLRGEVFGHVSRRHVQAEAEARLVALDTHFPKQMRRGGSTPRASSISP